MSVTVCWLMSQPATLSREEFEEWYLGTHAEVARRLPGLRRYAISRCLDAVAGNDVYRIAQLVWDDVSQAEAAFNAPEGYVTVADGALNTPGAEYVEAMAVTVDRPLEVTYPGSFDIVEGGFRGCSEGQQVRILAYGSGPGPDVAALRRDHAGLIGDPRLRGHIVGRSEGSRLRIGRTTLPANGQRESTWSWELWFDDEPAARAMVDEPEFAAAWASVAAGSEHTFRGFFRSQELLCSVPATR